MRSLSRSGHSTWGNCTISSTMPTQRGEGSENTQQYGSSMTQLTWHVCHLDTRRHHGTPQRMQLVSEQHSLKPQLNRRITSCWLMRMWQDNHNGTLQRIARDTLYKTSSEQSKSSSLDITEWIQLTVSSVPMNDRHFSQFLSTVCQFGSKRLRMATSHD